jgi:Ankyrin repeats (3 copies)
VATRTETIDMEKQALLMKKQRDLVHVLRYKYDGEKVKLEDLRVQYEQEKSKLEKMDDVITSIIERYRDYVEHPCLLHKKVLDTIQAEVLQKMYPVNDGDKLLQACYDGDANAVSVLLKQGVDVNYTRSNGWTPLMTACDVGNIDIVRMLIEANADYEAKNENGNTAFYIASVKDRKEIMTILMNLP